MALQFDVIVQCDHCQSVGRSLPIRICHTCEQHVCRDCAYAAARHVVPQNGGFVRSVLRELEVTMGSCPTCQDRSTAPQPVEFRLASW